MTFIRHLIRSFLVLLLVSFGTSSSANVGGVSDFQYHVQHQELLSKARHLTSTARAPPITSANVMATGTAFAQTGNLRALDGVETHLASFGFGVGLDAPNGETRLSTAE